jgi:hypothetical protein
MCNFYNQRIITKMECGACGIQTTHLVASNSTSEIIFFTWMDLGSEKPRFHHYESVSYICRKSGLEPCIRRNGATINSQQHFKIINFSDRSHHREQWVYRRTSFRLISIQLSIGERQMEPWSDLK